MTEPIVASSEVGPSDGRHVVRHSPMRRDGQVVARKVMTGTLPSDHRVVDGVAAAEFPGTLKGPVEDPGRWVKVGA